MSRKNSNNQLIIKMTYIDYHRRYKLCFNYPEKSKTLWLICSLLSTVQIIPKEMNLSFRHSATALQRLKINLVAVIHAALPTNYSNSDSTTIQRCTCRWLDNSTIIIAWSSMSGATRLHAFYNDGSREDARRARRTERVEAVSYAKKHALMISARFVHTGHIHYKSPFSKELNLPATMTSLPVIVDNDPSPLMCLSPLFLFLLQQFVLSLSCSFFCLSISSSSFHI